MSDKNITVFYLGTCRTCVKIVEQLKIPKHALLREIKTEAITPAELATMVQLAGSHESLFSRKAMKYRSLGLNEQQLTEDDYKKYILMEYTFLKRPVIVVNNAIFIGNAGVQVKGAYDAIHG
jgi:arsenate reductase (glutaredoxin)